jgi:hypothetical protein
LIGTHRKKHAKRVACPAQWRHWLFTQRPYGDGQSRASPHVISLQSSAVLVEVFPLQQPAQIAAGPEASPVEPNE